MPEFAPVHRDVVGTIDRRAWKKYAFYADIVVWAILVVSLALIMRNLYLIGWARGELDIAASDMYWWRAMTALGFFVGALAWVFFRFWRNGYAAMRRPF